MQAISLNKNIPRSIAVREVGKLQTHLSRARKFREYTTEGMNFPFFQATAGHAQRGRAGGRASGRPVKVVFQALQGWEPLSIFRTHH